MFYLSNVVFTRLMYNKDLFSCWNYGLGRFLERAGHGHGVMDMHAVYSRAHFPLMIPGVQRRGRRVRCF